MNDELKTKEYLTSLEQIKLADSSRLRLKDELLAHARFHAVKEVVPTTTRSPYIKWLFATVPMAALALVLLVGASPYLLHNGSSNKQFTQQDTQDSDSLADAQGTQEIAPPSGETSTTDTPTILAQNTPAPTNLESAGDMARSARTKAAPESSVIQDEASADSIEMSTMLAQGTWSIDEHLADVTLRERTLRALIKKYEADIEADTKTELITKLDATAKLIIEAQGVSEAGARSSLDKASMLVGEIESTLSLLGAVTTENGLIIKIDF